MSKVDQNIDGVATQRVLTVLLVEDNAGDVADFQEHLLNLRPDNIASWNLLTAESLADALEQLRLKIEGIDVVVLNLSLPDSKGLDTFACIKESLGGTRPILVLGGEENSQDLAVELLKLGAQDYLPKESLGSDLIGRSILYAIERNHYDRERAAYQLTIEHLDSALELHRDEVSELQKQLIQSEKLESLGRLAAGVAHEIKNPLAMVQMGIDFFNNRRNPEDETEGKMLDIMGEALLRADGIVVDMVDFSKPRDFKFGAQDVNEIVERAIRMVGSELKHHEIKLKKDLAKDLPLGRADSAKIEQVLINILVNSIHASEDGAVIEISTSCMSPQDLITDEGERAIHKVRSGNDVIAVTVLDHGTGIPADKLDKIFEPFFTTKPTGMGAGLGLSVSKTIVELHGGRLRIKNANTGGVRAEVFLQQWREW